MQIQRGFNRTKLLGGAVVGAFGAILLTVLLTLTAVVLRADTGTCGGVITSVPFLDVSGNPFFCQIAQAFFSGLTNGTSSSSYSPSNMVTREQMAAFVTRTLDQSLSRGSRRAALNQRWILNGSEQMQKIQLPNASGSPDSPHRVQSDGTDIWVTGNAGLYRVRASDGVLLEAIRHTYGLNPGRGVLVASGHVYVVHQWDANVDSVSVRSPSGTWTSTVYGLPRTSDGIAFDGRNLWLGSNAGRIVKVRIHPSPEQLDGTFYNTPAISQPRNVIYDGTNIWATDFGGNSLVKLDANTNIVQTVSVGANPLTPAFDGINLWVPNYGSGSVTVVRAATGAVVATLTGNGLSTPSAVAFDGERILVTNENAGTVSLFKATDLSPLGSFSVGVSAVGVCSDGINFWIADFSGSRLIRF